MTLAILTAVIAPAAGDYIEEARNVKAKEDVEAIGTGILRLLRDTGLPCVSNDASVAAPCSLTTRVDVLVSGGSSPGVTGGAYSVPAGDITQPGGDAASVNWVGATSTVVGGANNDTNVPIAQTDTVDNQLVKNTPAGNGAKAYSSASLFTAGGGPRAGIGWRGAYLTGPIGADPWGTMYEANTVFLTPASNATASAAAEGDRYSGWKRDVVVVSAGSNGTLETTFGADGTTAAGDDIIYTVQGASR
jgi:hypothetical protein